MGKVNKYFVEMRPIRKLPHSGLFKEESINEQKDLLVSKNNFEKHYLEKLKPLVTY